MRRTLALAIGIAALTAYGASAATAGKSRPITFGIEGGNIVPFHVVISPAGKVTAHGRTVKHKHFSRTTARKLRDDVRAAFSSGDVASKQCSGTNPDVGTQFIRYGGSTIKVHGGCEPRFTRLWNELANAVGLSGN